MRRIIDVPPTSEQTAKRPRGRRLRMMANNQNDIPLSQVFGTVLMSEVAVLLAVVVMALVFKP
jgi:hypothetical protein